MAQKCDASKQELETDAKTEASELKCCHYPVKSAVRLITETTVASKAKNGCLGKWLSFVFSEVLKTWKSFNIRFAVIHTLCHDWQSQKHVPSLLTAMHTCWLSVQRSFKCMWGIHCKYIHVVKCIEVVLSKAVHQHGYHCFLSSSVTFFLFIAVQRSDTTADSEVDFSPPGM